MITPNELRIGNYVYNIHGDIVKIETGSQIDRIEWYSKIALTEHFIRDLFGFTKDEHQPYGDVATLYTMVVKIASNDNELNAACKHYDGDYSVNVSYTVEGFWASNNVSTVHKLQNLIFALTGKEFEIKF